MNFKENIPATSSTTTSAPRLVAMDSPEKEELLTGKKVGFEEQPPGVQEDEKTSEKISKRLNFPEMETTNIDNYHMVRGDRICGLLVDPGAASGLIGTDTLRELLDAGMFHKIELMKFLGDRAQPRSPASAARAMTLSPGSACPLSCLMELKVECLATTQLT